MSLLGQSLPKHDFRVASVYPSISDIIVQYGERRDGPKLEVAVKEESRPRVFHMPLPV
jgi:hypothetical protein